MQELEEVMPDADGLRQRAEQWLRDIEEREGLDGLAGISEDYHLIRDLLAALVAVGDRGLQAHYCAKHPDKPRLDGCVECVAEEIAKARRRAEAAEAQRQGLQTRIAALAHEIRGMATASAMAENPVLAEVFKRWADILATLIQPGAASEERQP